jgi:uncharacterized DUF497 family protein
VLQRVREQTVVILEFYWDEANISHIARHGVLPEEAEQVILNEPFDIGYDPDSGEDRIEQIGETNAGRILVAVTTERGKQIRVVTCYEPSKAARLDYLAAKGAEYGTEDDEA